MYRTFLIVAATLLGIGTAVLIMRTPVRADMKRTVYIITGLCFVAGGFFVTTKSYDNNYGWWYVPVFVFAVAGGLGLVRRDAINRSIEREKPSQWLLEIARSMPTTGATVKETAVREEPDVLDFEEEEPDYETLSDLPFLFDEEESRPRRPLDDYYVADEADTWPTQLDLKNLDEFIFASRHGYLVHDRGGDKPVCDVMTISPGMSIADLVDAAMLHTCVKEVAA